MLCPLAPPSTHGHTTPRNVVLTYRCVCCGLLFSGAWIVVGRFHVLNVHTMDELKLTGNSMLGSRPLLNFDAKFDQTPHWQ